MARSQAAVPLIVLSGREDDVELVNRSLRDGGHAVRCLWVAKVDALAGALDDHEPELLCFFPDSLPAPIRDIAKIKQQAARTIPLVVISKAAEETDIADALLAGAADLVSLGQTERLRSVAERELRAFRLERALNETLLSANQYKNQLKAFMAGSVDAIAHVQEGIIVDANQAWAELFGHGQAESALGPLMDCFQAGSQAALKGAVVACTKGQWKSDHLKVVARAADGSPLPLEIALAATAFDGDPAIKLCVPRRAAAPLAEPEALVDEAVNKDATTGFYHRRRFLEVLTDRLDAGPRKGVRALAYLRPDKFREIEDQIGPISSEDVLVQIAEQLRALTQPADVCGRFGGQVFTIFVERGTLRDVEAWAQNAIARIAERIFSAAHNTLSVTCTIGLAEVGPATERMESLIVEAKRSNQSGRERGGNCVVLEQTSDESTRVQRFDEIQVQQIKTALMENRFRLAHLPIANLIGEQKTMFDTVIRMIDAQGDELAATEFMPAAARNRMLRAIDRWVIGATLQFVASTVVDCVFVKLSSESLIDKTLLDWLAKAVDSSAVEPDKLCFQISEEDATQYLSQTKTLAEKLGARGHRFAIEHFGIGRDSARVLASTPMHFLKIDGSLMQSLSTDQGLQERVRTFIGTASKRGIPTIAERVEDANTMAVLFQLGAAYMQGHYVHEPEVILAEAR
ncbi:MAG TPA: GGDEF domain-containing protein [Gammaproteobacteria bacterium]|nr:GGDEF domain-containing protein [Gammaproteobacteria bacterium]